MKAIATSGKNTYEQLTVCCVGCLFFSVLWNDFINKWKRPSSVARAKRSLNLAPILNEDFYRGGREVCELENTTRDISPDTPQLVHICMI